MTHVVVLGYHHSMTFVNMKELEAAVGIRIMALINRRGDGMNLQRVRTQFFGRVEIPGWSSLNHRKRAARVNRVIGRLVRGGHARIEGEAERDLRLIPLNALDKIVLALDQEEGAPGGKKEAP